MSGADTHRTARIEARLAPETLDDLRRAAELQGRSLSDFVVAAAHEAARRTIAEVDLIRLARADQERFAAALLDPPGPTDALRRAAQAHARLIRGGT